MTVDQFINSRINPSRGGYPPDEAAQLIRQAWQAAVAEERERIVKGLDQAIRRQCNGV